MDTDHSLASRADSVGSRAALTLAVFAAAVFTSALLLFAVQPMFTRMVLPILGGSPAVWSVAMVFFQSMLLGGYAYAHCLTRMKRPTFSVGIHLLVVAAAGMTLPPSIAAGWGDPPNEWAAFWLLGLFAVSIGLAFFALAANTPLLQAWFVRTGHADAKDPYFLYATSNIGSFLALLSYPILVEPTLSLRAERMLWSGGFWLLFVLIAACGAVLLRSPAYMAQIEEPAETAAPSWQTVGAWIFLSAIPSGLLVAVTAHISTDVAAAPLLWVIPLSLYLLTWVLVFQRRPLLPHRWMLALHPVAIAGLVVLLAYGYSRNLAINLAGHLIAFFLIAMACHGELARRRPPAGHLTTFYVSLSGGGVIGGLFAGLLAPYMFSWIAEYPILIVLAALCRPFSQSAGQVRDGRFWIVAVVLALALLAPGALAGWAPTDEMSDAVNVVIVIIAVVGIAFARQPLKFAFTVAVALTLVRIYPADEEQGQTVRSFFGVHKVYDTADGEFRVLMHGTTIHGAQRLRDAAGKPVVGRPEPLTYYHSASAMAQTINAVRVRKGAALRVAVVGLGSGSLACYVRPGDSWTFFEIDSAVVGIARDPRRFGFLSSCAPDVPVVVGDARLTLARETDGSFDLIVVDAFSSDSIPVHLATREAMAVYKSKLAPNGVVLMHISNRHLELASVVAGIAAANGLKTWVYNGKGEKDDDDEYIFDSDVAVAAAEEADIGELSKSGTWTFTGRDRSQRVWADDYSNVVGAIWRKRR